MRNLNVDMDSPTNKLHTATSARQVYSMAKEIEQNRQSIEQETEKSAKINSTLVEGAEANIAQKALFEQQIEILRGQNDLLFDNYSKLKELFDAQVEANKETKDELKQSRRFNTAMMIIAVISMIAAVAGPIVTILVS